MASLVDIDPMRGVETWADGDESNRLQVHYRQDVEPILELAKYERNNGLSDQRYKKTGMALYARIPPVIILELRHKYGVDIFKRDHLRRAMQLIESEYPALKCTDRTHGLRS
jgi:hypothetical protein